MRKSITFTHVHLWGNKS